MTSEDHARSRFLRACAVLDSYKRMPKNALTLPNDPVDRRRFYEAWARAKLEKQEALEELRLWRGVTPARSKTVRLRAR